MAQRTQFVETSTIHTIRIVLEEEVVNAMRDMGVDDTVQVQFVSQATGRLPTPKRLSYTDIMRLTTNA